MTAEAVVLNKTAVAMAADSAVTISGGRRQMVKTYDTANKLFELVRGRPVGTMTFANAEVNGVPWETVIKAFRRENAGLELPSLADYTAAFLEYMRDSSRVFSEESERFTFQRIAYEVCLHIASYYESRIPGCLTSTGRPIKRKLRETLVSAIDHVAQYTESLPEAPWRDELDQGSLTDEFGHLALEVFDSVFPQQDLLLVRDRRRVVHTITESCRRGGQQPSESGLVIAGFGEHESFPSLRSFRVRGRLRGVLMASEAEQIEISQSNPGQVQTFAQDEIAWGFLTGINEVVRREVMDYWTKWIGRSEDETKVALRDAGLRLSPRTVGKIAKAHRELLDRGFGDFLAHMQDHEDARFRQPILSSVQFLPRAELAMLAESLVNLTSIWQRVSVHSAETVGGEIDVALISVGDGYVWIKRKHYFTTDLNPAWPLTHAGLGSAQGHQPT